MSRGLLILAVLLLAAAAGVWSAGSAFWGVLIGIVMVGVLLMRSLIVAVLHRLPLTAGNADLEPQLRPLVAATGKDVLRELRRLGLPGHSWTLPLLAVRLIGKRRVETAERLRGFDVEKVVPAARLDEVHLLLQGIARQSGS